MSIYPAPNRTNIYNDVDYTSNVDENASSGEIDDRYVKKTGSTMSGMLTVPILKFADNTTQHTSYDSVLMDSTVSDVSSNTYKLSTVNYDDSTVSIPDLSCNVLNVNGIQSQAFTSSDKFMISDNAGRVALLESDVSSLDSAVNINTTKVNQNEADIALNTTKVNQNEADIALNTTKVNQNEADIALNTTKVNQNETDIALHTAEITQLKNKDNTHTSQITQLGVRTTSLEQYPKFAQINLSMIDILGEEIQNGVDTGLIDHDFNIGQWIHNNTSWGIFSSAGVWNTLATVLEISMSFKLSAHYSDILRCQSGLRNKLPSSLNDVFGALDPSTLASEHASTLTYIDSGMRTSGSVTMFRIYRYNCTPYIIQAGNDLVGYYQLLLNTRLQLQTNLISTKDIVGCIVIKMLK